MLKIRTIMLTLCMGILSISGNNLFSQENTGSSEDSVKNEMVREQKQQDKTTIDNLKIDQKNTKIEKQEAQRVQNEASDAAKQSKNALKAEKKAQRSRKHADEQAKKAEKARNKSDQN